MTRIRCTLALLICVALTADASAQFFPPVFGLPTIGQNGIKFHMGGKRLSIDGFLPLGDPYPAILPVTPTPFGFQQVAPAFLPYGYYGYPYPPVAPGFPFPAYGSIDQRITVQIINPPGLGPRAGFRPVYDTSGIDLDVEPASKIWGDKGGALAKGPAKKGELAKAEARKPEVARVAPAPAVAAANQVKPPAPPIAPKPLPPLDGQGLNDLGVAAFRNGEFGLAMLRFRQAGDDDKPAPRALFLQAQAYIAVGKYRDAVETIRKGLQAQPDWPKARFDPRTELYADQKEAWNAHRTALERTQAENPKNADFLFLLGYVAWFDGQREVAIDHFTRSRALAAEPRWADAFLKAGKVN